MRIFYSLSFLFILLILVRIGSTITLPLVDRSESRYAVMAKNMAVSGDFVKPTFVHDRVSQTFMGKPPLLFQLGGLACKVFGVSAFAVRLPSLLAAGLTLLLIFIFTHQIKAVIICTTSIGFFLFSGICMTDMLLTLAVCGTLLMFLSWQKRNCVWKALVCALFISIGFLSKGPVILLLTGIPILLWTILHRKIRNTLRFHWLIALIFFLLLTIPWFVLIEQAEPGSLHYFFFNENLGRFVSHAYGDRYGAGREAFYGASILWFLLLSAPWCLLLIHHSKQIDFRSLPVLGILCIVGFWCLTSRVPLAYLLPTVPLTALVVSEHVTRGYKFFATTAAVSFILLCVSFTVIAPYTIDKFPARFYKALPPNMTVQFSETAPYSAEFYLGNRVRYNEAADLLLIRARKYKRATGLEEYKPLIQRYRWVALLKKDVSL
ncbi:MAG: glycosyltransferase family 39 protein [Kiritimatiellia bacterium]